MRYGSPTSWDYNGTGENSELCLYDSDLESDLSSEMDSSSADSTDSQQGVSTCRGLRITFKGDYLAEAEEDDFLEDENDSGYDKIDWEWQDNNAVNLEVSN